MEKQGMSAFDTLKPYKLEKAVASFRAIVVRQVRRPMRGSRMLK